MIALTLREISRRNEHVAKLRSFELTYEAITLLGDKSKINTSYIAHLHAKAVVEADEFIGSVVARLLLECMPLDEISEAQYAFCHSWEMAFGFEDVMTVTGHSKMLADLPEKPDAEEPDQCQQIST